MGGIIQATSICIAFYESVIAMEGFSQAYMT